VSTLESLPLLASGKVREMYDLGDRLLIVASDRISTYDVVHPMPSCGHATDDDRADLTQFEWHFRRNAPTL